MNEKELNALVNSPETKVIAEVQQRDILNRAVRKSLLDVAFDTAWYVTGVWAMWYGHYVLGVAVLLQFYVNTVGACVAMNRMQIQLNTLVEAALGMTNNMLKLLKGD